MKQEQYESVFAFKYHDCVHEGHSAVMTLHKTREGAEKSMEQHKAFELKEWNELYANEEPPYPFGYMSRWYIAQTEIMD